MLIIDAHLDLSYNAIHGKDVLLPAHQQKQLGAEIPTVGLPELRAGSVRLVCATVFTEPSFEGSRGYTNAEQAYLQGQQHLAWYRQQVDDRVMSFVTRADQLGTVHASTGQPQQAILLMEGADPLRDIDDLFPWHEFGLRIIGLAWKRTRFAGGTGMPGPLTDEGVRLVKAMDQLRMIHDASHLAEESFWQLLKISSGPVMASHSNCRAIVPTDRQLSDDMIRAIAERGGVIGINFFDRFLLPPAEHGKRRATLADVALHARHICDVTGSTEHVAIGTDMDGGLGRNEIPIEIETSADLPRLADGFRAAGFTAGDVERFLSENWLRFFAAHF